MPGAEGAPGLYVRQSKLARATTEAAQLPQLALLGTRYLSTFFGQPFPFQKYDMVLIPGFPFGGMEHAGATFLREESVLFRTAPTHTDLINRDLLVLHELTHQWFGDLVTMQWFDDLWLKEGFAQYMAYQALAALKPAEPVWKHFYEHIKPSAYAIDSTPGTTPLYQDIPNLKDAKSAYGAIVYSKAPGVLKELAFVLGEENFRAALRLYLAGHAYGNARWSDLVRALEAASGRNLSSWARMWIRTRGMPEVSVRWSCNGDLLSHIYLSQHDVLHSGALWPIATEVALFYDAAPRTRLRVDFSRAQTEVVQARGKRCPRFVFANDQDRAYGRFLLDARSRAAAALALGAMPDAFDRTLLWGALWEAVRQGDLAPRRYLELVAALLPMERDEALNESLYAHAAVALHRYLSDDARSRLVPALETMATEQMLRAPDQDLRIVGFRALGALAETPNGLAQLKALLHGNSRRPA